MAVLPLIAPITTLSSSRMDEVGQLGISGQSRVVYRKVVGSARCSVAQDAEAGAIAEGLVRYLTTDDPGSGYNGTSTTSRRLYTGSPGGCVDPPLDGAPAGDLSTEGRYTDVVGGVHGAGHR